MGNKTASRGSGTRRAVKKRVEKSGQEKPVALTLKVDSRLYVRLSTLRATQRTTNQNILEQALTEYLTRAGA
jgi:hypothetical protein